MAWWWKAAEAGDADALCCLANAFAMRGGEEDLMLAEECWRCLADAGHSGAMALLALSCLSHNAAVRQKGEHAA